MSIFMLFLISHPAGLARSICVDELHPLSDACLHGAEIDLGSQCIVSMNGNQTVLHPRPGHMENERVLLLLLFLIV
jgi:hypothetical protein